VAIRQQVGTDDDPFIVRDAQILSGEPVVRGTRIPVRSIVLAAREYGGKAGAQKAYPHLEIRAIEAALAYYERHRVEIDWYIDENSLDD
jgi:uncharacterized protein (DUF433 family)